MNLNSFADNPKDLDYYDDQDLVPLLAWYKYSDNYIELKKREELWSRDSLLAYHYARHILKGPFELGEPAIAGIAQHSYWYAYCVLNGPFKLGEVSIATHPQIAFCYAMNVLHGRFELDERSILEDSFYSVIYEKLLK